MKTGHANWVASRVGPTSIFTLKKFKKRQINAKFLERMNQINQGKELHLIPFVLFCFFFFFGYFSLSGHLLLLDYLLPLYMWREKNKQTKKHKAFHILPILTILSLSKILYSNVNKILHVNNSQLYKFTERERERDSKELQKVYILSLHTLDSKFSNDMDFWTISFTLVLFCTSQT